MENTAKKEITYKLVKIGKTSKSREDFFNWALSHKMYKTVTDGKFNSRMKAVYTKAKKTEALTVVVAIQENEPVGLLLCEDDGKKYKLGVQKRNQYYSDIKEHISTDCVIAGFLSFFVKEKARGQGIAVEMLKLMELEHLKYTMLQKDDNKKVVQVFEAREKAIDLVRDKSEYTYCFTHSRNEYNFVDCVSRLALHRLAVDQKNTHSINYENKGFISPKKEITLEVIENNKLKTTSINKLLEIIPIIENYKSEIIPLHLRRGR